MRKENEVINQILDFANNEDRVRAVMMNGSRVNANAPKDIMQDYDIVFFITDIEDLSYKINQKWIKAFGELVIMQQNDFDDGSYIFLMQFKNGVRIDLSFKDIKNIREIVKEDTLSKILLNKDDNELTIPIPNDTGYYVLKPSKKEFDKLLNESWWIQTYVAKGIWRDELPLAKYMFDVILMDCIRTLLSWHIGEKHEWNINVGKCGKWFEKYLSDEMYNDFVSIYPTIDYDEMWESLFRAGRFIRKLGNSLAESLEYHYPTKDDINVTEYIKKIKTLPRDAKEFR
ncbi:aminoglycoside 6-adenylyltransferase [Tissierella pigra]|uniref:Aminoglycoside 6-adenylyltransferase n=1 Tax=Tissierella pigra TaxID=2607614 RepID=A0A6N7XZB3_9FIRM|nr:aminoglycoside 6-adenylyltransferase [Tissierella pigra]MBU5427487.1 aminoglycoside 6-adenylyltransferase [Tissierella pigra]MSU03177.1 aminoglycoside 6-adenylyltransferase [Tissierella pigra]